MIVTRHSKSGFTPTKMINSHWQLSELSRRDATRHREKPLVDVKPDKRRLCHRYGFQ